MANVDFTHWSGEGLNSAKCSLFTFLYCRQKQSYGSDISLYAGCSA